MRPLFALPLLLLLACATTPKPVPDYGSGSGVSVSPRGASLVSLLEGQAMAPVGSPSWLGQAYSLTLNAPSGATAISIAANARLQMGGPSYYLKSDGGGILTAVGLTVDAQSFRTSVGSGVNGFSVLNNGARIDFGAGASDYASSDGTTVTFAGPVSTAGGFTATNSISASGGSGISFGFAGGYVQPGTGVIPTCVSGIEGRIVRDNTAGGTGTSTRTKICVCTSDGAASPAYAWVNIAKDAASQVGTTTTCP